MLFSISSRGSILLAALSMNTILPLSPLQASGLVRYVSTTGLNTNDCLVATPCRTIAGAITKTPLHGEIRVLESGFYGSNATITKSITLSGERPDVTLSRFVLRINDPTAKIAIRNLHFVGGFDVPAGVEIQNARNVTFERVVVQGYTESAIWLKGPTSHTTIVDSTIRDNKGSGIQVDPGAASRISILRSRLIRNFTGLKLTDGSLFVANSLISESGTGLILGGTAIAMLESSIVRANTDGLFVTGSGATASISNMTIVDNTLVGVRIVSGASVVSRGNNVIVANSTDVAGSLGNYSPQ